MFGSKQEPLYIGFNDQLTVADAHGVVFIGGVEVQVGLPFIVNNPGMLVEAAEVAADELFSQVTKLGLLPKTIQFLVGESRRIFEFKEQLK